MECIYCGQRTEVRNSRPQRKINSVWRRRACTACRAIFTTTEQADAATALMVAHSGLKAGLVPFNRDQLFLSVYDSCRHRPAALKDATSLTATAISEILRTQETPGVVSRAQIITVVYALLKRYDVAAATAYQAFHPL